MGKAAINSTGSRAGSLPESVSEPNAAEPMALFGIKLTRLLRVPLEHLGLSLCILILSTVAAVVYAKYTTKATYESVGTLIHRPPTEQKDIPAPKNLETHIEELKNLRYYRKLNETFQLGIPPEIFANFFVVTKPPDSSVIQVKLKWDDREDAPKLINALMDIHRKESEAYRRKELGYALRGTTEAVQAVSQNIKEIVTKRDDLLRDKKVSGNPKEKVAAFYAEARSLDVALDTARFDYARLLANLKRCQEAIEDLKTKRKEGVVKDDDEGPDEEFTQRKRQIELDLVTFRQELAEKLRLLKAKENEHQLKKPLADKGVIIQPVIAELEREIKNAAEQASAIKKKIDIKMMEKNDLLPGSAKLRLLVGERSGLQLKEPAARAEVERYEQQRDAQRKRARDMEEVEREWLPLERRIEVLQKEEDVLRAKQSELEQRMRNVDAEFEIGSPAEPSLISSGDFKKRLGIGFLVPMLVGFGALVTRDMLSRAWRAETLADRLHLPVLAKSPPARKGEVPQLSNDGCRALSLRLRQFLPEEGAVVLVSSLNDGRVVDQLVSGVSRYFGMRNERVLILDARIALAESLGLGPLIERRADGGPVQVVPGEAAAGATALGPVGLVQALVFEGQNWTEFTYHTRLAGVDYIPSGGPYHVTDALACEPMDDMVKALRAAYTLIVVVGPALSRSVDTEILAAFASGMIVVLDEPLGSFGSEVQESIRSLREAKPDLLLGAVICV